MDAFGKEYYLSMLSESVSQCFKVSNTVSDGGVFKRKCLMGK